MKREQEQTPKAKPLPGLIATPPKIKIEGNELKDLYRVVLPIYQDGVCVRQAARLRIEVDGSAFKVTIECPTECVMTSCISLSLEQAMDVLCEHLKGPNCVWAPDWFTRKKERRLKA